MRSLHPWAIVDPVLQADLELRAVADHLVRTVDSAWTDVPTFRPLEPRTWSFLSRHRVATVIPPDAVDAAQRGEFVERLQAIQATQMRIEATARDVTAVLDDAGIEARILKGLASAHLDYPRPELRHTGDVDIAVRADDITHASALFDEALGYRPKSRPDRSRHVTKGVTLKTPRNVEVDLHDRLFVRSRPCSTLVSPPGEPLSAGLAPGLSSRMRLVNAAGSFMLTPIGHRRLSGLLDVTALRSRGVAADGRTIGHARAARVGGIVGDTLRLEARLARRIDRSLVDWPSMGPLDRATRNGPRRRLVLEHVVRLRHVPIRQVPAYLPTWLLPDRADRDKLARSVRERRQELCG